jgi:hypothetical protein
MARPRDSVRAEEIVSETPFQLSAGTWRAAVRSHCYLDAAYYSSEHVCLSAFVMQSVVCACNAPAQSLCGYKGVLSRS